MAAATQKEILTDEQKKARAVALARWHGHFRTADESSWPVAMISVQNEIHSREHHAIDIAAKQHGYQLLSKGANLTFIRNAQREDKVTDTKTERAPANNERIAESSKTS